MPLSSVVITMYEPRYINLYDEILARGDRRFALVQMNPQTGELMEMAAVLYILKAEKVALNPPNPFGKRTFASPVEQNEGPTGPKSDATYVYVGQHFVEGRVKILKILNPSAYFTQTEYLWAHVQVRSLISSPCSHITDTHTHTTLPHSSIPTLPHLSLAQASLICHTPLITSFVTRHA